MATRAGLAVRVVTVGALFGDGDEGDRKGDVAPRKGLTMGKRMALRQPKAFIHLPP
jgi:hypothetical protein